MPWSSRLGDPFLKRPAPSGSSDSVQPKPSTPELLIVRRRQRVGQDAGQAVADCAGAALHRARRAHRARAAGGQRLLMLGAVVEAPAR